MATVQYCMANTLMLHYACQKLNGKTLIAGSLTEFQRAVLFDQAKFRWHTDCVSWLCPDPGCIMPACVPKIQELGCELVFDKQEKRISLQRLTAKDPGLLL